MPNYWVRPPTPEDAPALIHIRAAASRVAFVDPLRPHSAAALEADIAGWLSADYLEYFSQFIETEALKPSVFLRLILCDATIVGYINAYTNAAELCRIQALYLKPDYFGTGASNILMEEFNRWAFGKSGDVYVLEYNTRAINFYRRHGFLPLTQGKNRIERITHLFRPSGPVSDLKQRFSVNPELATEARRISRHQQISLGLPDDQSASSAVEK
ncbi:MAG: GNAT family N-acetyltransferase [Propionibacteriaceae bacterium]|jgi:ribosomal protein S18 acetylase RimI-like enzyme|nr:GNAT family N-acetyltransferase [Propionibacteriaceae bacterium]